MSPLDLFRERRYLWRQSTLGRIARAKDRSRFHVAMLNTPGKRLTWRVLTNQNDAGFMGIS